MDATYEYLWAAGYGLPPETQPAPKPVQRRGKKAAKRRKAKP